LTPSRNQKLAICTDGAGKLLSMVVETAFFRVTGLGRHAASMQIIFFNN